jgi:protein-S-isoprenylcysteine O-methyltransferase Ste14
VRQIIGWALVLAQLVLLVGCVLPVGAQLWSAPGVVTIVLRLVGGLFALAVIPLVLSLGPAATPSPVPREEGALATTGPYGVVRHPVYTVLIVGAWCLALATAHVGAVVAALLLTLLLLVKAMWEERLLAERFPDYPAYARRVPRWIPRWRR